jgi:uncharacterized membrane protein YtjA (UPF0391 family)
MQMQPHHHHASHADENSRGRSGKKAAALTWSVTFLLLGLVSAIFAFGGTTGESAGQFIRAATVGFLVLAATVFMIFRNHRNLP